MDKLNILLTNDDGIECEGLKVLAEQLSKVCNVYIVAPSTNRSGVASSISMYEKLKITKINEKTYTCSGTPVDCVITALKSPLLNVKIDAVVSGINKGANLGTDVIYSGTASAARQATFEGVPGIALSVESYDGTWKFLPLAEYIAANIKRFITSWKQKTFFNINAASLDKYNGEEFASLSNRNYHDKVIIEKDGEGYLAHYGSDELTTTGEDNNDFAITKKGKIAISVLASEPCLFT